ncbi:N-acetylneuraminate synthase [Candidatus Falkowbacteria bacterium CG10_big_fil_rev_8_21_14_0_10_44_15]|uniref:N-acetylneuraminate synthase n=1 Tax=Candidatus Falkowbacteria bacterium CG10_big_fil_rev_8_21_14_0_10_44_15 TaxID=1974569 RepID=A0A2H0V1C8_9BACT|nr:MAG: N-acetylneuraminate synthase [Candidatus Falkowbacteria bacterium CG10_big_fil_rev_8_21_14_0_10_44_15]
MTITIGNKKIGGREPVFIVAELGINHNGSLSLAKKMIKAAKQSGADAVKIQSFVTEDFVGDKKLKYTYRSRGKSVTESQYDMFKRNELTKKAQSDLFNYAKNINIIIFSTPQDNSFKTVNFLCGAQLNMPAIKVGSDDLTNLPMLSHYAKKKKPMIISTGMGTLSEIKDAVTTIKKEDNTKIIILKCTSLYPTQPQQANLAQIITLQKHFPDLIIGFSDHTSGSTAAVISVVLGAKVIEKHFTLDKNLPGPDHWFAADPTELFLLVRQVREAETMLGRTDFNLSKEELKMKKIARRSIMAAQDIAKGRVIAYEDLTCKRPGTGFSPKHLLRFVGKIAKCDYKKGYIFTKKDL